MQKSCEGNSKQNSQDRVRQASKKLLKLNALRKRFDCVFDQSDADKQHSEAKNDHSDGFHLFPGHKEVHHAADEQQKRGERCQVERSDLCRNGCTDIGAHDDGDGFLQIHQT